MKKPILYECGICDCYHPWGFNGDCRDDDNRYPNPEEFLFRNGLVERGKFDNIAYGYAHLEDYVEIRTTEERIEADIKGEA